MNTTPRASKYIEECPQPVKFAHIEEFKLDDNKSCYITGNLELVKHISAMDYKMNYLKKV
jgi:hypothetical protein